MAEQFSTDLIIRAIAEGFDKVAGEIGKVGTGVDKAADAAESGSTRFTELNNALALVQQGFGYVSQAAEFVWDTLSRGADIERTQQKFDRLAVSIGTTGEALKAELLPAIDGLMSEADSMALATDLMVLGLAKTKEEAVRLATVSAGLGMDMNQLVLTLTNMTTMRFDALGLSVDGFAEKVKGLEAAGMGAQEAFKMAFLEQAEGAIETVGSVADTTAGQIMKIESAWQDVQDAFAKGVAKGIGDELGGFDEAIRNSTVAAEELGVALVDLATLAVPAIIEFTESLPPFIEGLAQVAKFKDVIDDIFAFMLLTTPGGAPIALAGLATELEILGVSMDDVEKKLKNMDFVLPEFDAEAKAQAMQIQIISDAYGSIDPVIANYVENQKAIEEANSGVIQSNDDLIESTGRTHTEMFLMKDAIDNASAAASGQYPISLEAITIAQDKATISAEEEAAALEVLKDAYREAAAASGDYFTQAVENQADPKYVFDLGDALYKQADAAGASATQLALLGLATGDLSEEQAIAALKMAAVNVEIERMGQAIAAGLDPAVALAHLKEFIAGLGNEEFESVINPKVTVEPEFVMGDSAGRNIPEGAWAGDEGMTSNVTVTIMPEFVVGEGAAPDFADLFTSGSGVAGVNVPITPIMEGEDAFNSDMAKLFGAGATAAGDLPALTQDVSVEAEVSKATGPIADVQTAIDELPETTELEVTVNNQNAIDGLSDVLNLINELPDRKTIYVDVEFNATGDTEAAQAAGVEI